MRRNAQNAPNIDVDVDVDADVDLDVDVDVDVIAITPSILLLRYCLFLILPLLILPL